MRITAAQLLLLVLTLSVAFAGDNFAQGLLDRKVSVKITARSLKDVLIMLENAAQVKFVYSTSALDLTESISVDASDEKLGAVLNEVLKPRAIQFVVKNNAYIVLKKEQESSADVSEPDRGSTPAPPEARSVQGRVTDKDGQPLPGVNVLILGTNIGTATDGDGRYTIEARDGDVLTFSFIGFDREEVLVNGDVVNVVLHENVTQLSDVVVTGYYTRKAESFTGAAITISKDELRVVGNQNVLQSLAILDPSFRIVDNLDIGSDPNQLPNVQVRGQAGVPDLRGDYQTNPNQPLFILNGFQATMEQVYDLNMNFVESITILKDAAAKAIYGSRAANGVVVIETKRPEEGKMRINYNGSVDIQAPDLTSYDLTNSHEKIQAELLAGVYTSSTPLQQAQLTTLYGERLAEAERGVNTYWLSQPLRTGVGQKHNVYLDGGDDAMIYSVNVSYNNIKGVMKGSDRTTLSGTAGLSYRYKNLSFRNLLTIDNNKSVNSPYGDFGLYARMNPYWRIHDENGRLIRSYGNGVFNPLYDATLNTKDFSKYLTVTENFYGEWAITKNLRATARLGVNHADRRTEYFLPATHSKYATVSSASAEYVNRGEYTIGTGVDNNVTSDIGIAYNVERKKHALYTNAFYSIGQQSSSVTQVMAVGFPNDRMNDISMANQYLDGSSPTGSENTTRNLGVTFAANYTYDNRFLADFSYRLSGSSQFGARNRWGGFWGAGVGWNLHHERFIKQLRHVDQLKLRASTGYTGSQNFNSYMSVASYSYNTGQTYNGDIGLTLQALPNPYLQWQQTQDNNVGVDMGLFGRLTLRADYYLSRTNSLLSDVTTPPSSGFTSYKANIGRTENVGYQLAVSYKAYSSAARKSYLNLFVNIAHNANKIKEVSNGFKQLNAEQDADKDGNSGNITPEQRQTPSIRLEEGMSTETLWAVQSLGIDPANGKEIFRKKDGTLTYVWSSEDQIAAGDAAPKVMGSFGANFQYRSLTANVAFTFKAGGQAYNTTLVQRVENADISWNVDARFLSERWKEPGQASFYKNIADGTVTKPTTRFVEDLNELVFSSVSLMYDLRAVLARRKINNVRVGFNMNDLARISSMKTERGLSYPFARTLSFSVQATF
jgi:TonB-linked SusC/RagA family outer membrane protein